MISKPAILRRGEYKCQILEMNLKLRDQQHKTTVYICRLLYQNVMGDGRRHDGRVEGHEFTWNTAKRFMKRCWTLLIIRKMQIKTTMRNHLTPVIMTIIKKSTKNNCSRWCRERWTLLYTVGGNVNWCSHYKEWYLGSLQN